MTPREQAVELVAMAMWVREAERAAPNVAKSRTPETFADAGDETRGRWIGLAHAALDALTPLLVADDARAVRESGHRDGWSFAYRQWQRTGSVPEPSENRPYLQPPKGATE